MTSVEREAWHTLHVIPRPRAGVAVAVRLGAWEWARYDDGTITVTAPAIVAGELPRDGLRLLLDPDELAEVAAVLAEAETEPAVSAAG